MRCALLGPTPGSARRASINAASAGECFMADGAGALERQLDSGWQRQPAHGRRHLFLGRAFNPMYGIVYRGGDQILEHLALFGHECRLDLHALDLMASGHDDFDHAAAGFADDFQVRDFGLRLLHVRLQSLSLLHEIIHIGHRLHLCRSYQHSGSAGRTVSARTLVPKRSLSAPTVASASNAARAWARRSACTRSLERAGVSAGLSRTSISSRTAAPKYRASACASLSSEARVRIGALRGSSASR